MIAGILCFSPKRPAVLNELLSWKVAIIKFEP
jgi:hypothetical protein